MACGGGSSATRISASGRTPRPRAMACISGRMATAMRASGRTALSMARGLISFPIGMYTRGGMSRGNLMDMDSIAGSTDRLMLENSKMGLNMEKGNGRNLKMPTQITMREIINLTKRMAMEYLGGHQAIIIKDPIKMTKEMAMVKCIGLMARSISVNGEKEFSMDKVKCASLMELLKMEFLKIIYLKKVQKLLVVEPTHKQFYIQQVMLRAQQLLHQDLLIQGLYL